MIMEGTYVSTKSPKHPKNRAKWPLYGDVRFIGIEFI